MIFLPIRIIKYLFINGDSNEINCLSQYRKENNIWVEIKGMNVYIL